MDSYAPTSLDIHRGGSDSCIAGCTLCVRLNKCYTQQLGITYKTISWSLSWERSSGATINTTPQPGEDSAMESRNISAVARLEGCKSHVWYKRWVQGTHSNVYPSSTIVELKALMETTRRAAALEIGGSNKVSTVNRVQDQERHIPVTNGLTKGYYRGREGQRIRKDGQIKGRTIFRDARPLQTKNGSLFALVCPTKIERVATSR